MFLFTNRQRFDQSFGPYQDVDEFPNITSRSTSQKSQSLPKVRPF